MSGTIRELLRRTEITCKARYHAARRLNIHGWFSQWTLALLAVGQIVISLFAALQFKSDFTPTYLGFGSVFFGTLVLAYSLLLGMSDFNSRAVKLHGCGLELGRLARRLYPLATDPSDNSEEYARSSKEYYDILDKYENHTKADYLVARYEYYSGQGRSNLAWRPWLQRVWELQWNRFQYFFLHALQFSHYLASVLLISVWIFCAIPAGES